MPRELFETRPMGESKPGLELTTRLAAEKIARKNRKVLKDRATMGVGKALRNPYQ